MKKSIIILFCLWTSLLYADCGKESRIDPRNADGKMPTAYVPDPNSVFPPNVEGTQILHDIEIRNIGEGTLVIRKIGAA